MITEAALLCLSLNLFHEARGEPVMGQVAVAIVTINRANQKGHSDICRVVYAPRQFSWTHENKPKPKGFAWKTSQAVARMSLKLNPATFNLQGITHFHTTAVNPIWNRNMIMVGQHGNHLFYKDK